MTTYSTQTAFLHEIAVEEGHNPREHFDNAGLNALAKSITLHGIQQPLIVTKIGKGFKLVDGERRLRAAKIAGLNEVPVYVRDEKATASDLVAATITNLQREDLSPIEEAKAYKRLLESGEAKNQKVLATLISVSASKISERMQLLKLPEDVQGLYETGDVPAIATPLLIKLAIVSPEVATAFTRYAIDCGEPWSEIIDDPDYLLRDIVDAKGDPWLAHVPGSVQRVEQLGLSKGQTEVLSDALEEHGLKAGTLVPGTGRTTLALGVDDLDAALAYGCGIEIGERRGASWATGFCTDADWLVDRLVLRIEKAAKIITKAEKAKPGSTAKRDTAARGSSHVSDAMTAEKKARDLAAKEDAIPLNRDFGAALVKSYGKVPVTIDLLRLIAGMLWGDWQRARRVFERGIRYVDPQFSNEKGKVLAGVKLVDAVWAWLDRAPNVQEYAGRMMQIILASYAADQAAVSDSQRQWEKSPGESWVIEEPGTDGWAQERRLEAGSDPKNKQLLELTAAMHDFLLPVVPEAWRDRLPEPVPFVGAAVEEGLPEAA